MKPLFLVFVSWLCLIPLSLLGQTTVFSDAFTGTNGTLATAATPAVSYTSNLGLVGAPAGSASVQSNALMIANGNNATAGSNSNGLGYVSGSAAGFSSPFTTTLANNPNKVGWYVNFSNTRTGNVLSTQMQSSNYTQAIVLACDNADPRATGAKGYGLFLLRSATVATQNALYLIYFTNGISGVANSGTTNQTILQTTPDLYASGTGGSRYISAKATYEPSTGTWQLAYRNEATAYTIATDETTGYNTLTGVVNNAATALALPNFGFAWGFATTTGNNATFDNFTVRIIPLPVSPTISVSKTNLPGFVYYTGTGPAPAQTVDVSGLNLGTTAITITAPSNYEINNPGVDAVYSPSVSLTPSSGTVASTTINVRLKAGLSAGTYNQSITLVSSTASQTITCAGVVKNLTNPAAQTLPYSQNFSSFTGSSTTYPAGWQAWEVSANTPSSAGRTTAPDQDKDISGGDASSTGSGAYDFNGKIGFLSSATSDVALGLALNTTGKSNIEVTFDAMTIRNLYDGATNKYIEGIVFQYRVGTSGTFITLSYTPATYTQNQVAQIAGTTGQNIVTGNKAVLPSACNNQSVVQVRWILQATGTGDVKQSFALDNIVVQESYIATKADYYVDATAGNDGNAGTSAGAAWQSLAKVNSLIFSAGSRIFFKSDETWSGQLIPKGLGTAADVIIIGKYGSGAAPLINGAGIAGKATVYLENQQYWEVSDLEITNYPGLIADFDASTGGDRRGVFVAIYGFGTANHIYLKNLNIHHVRGQDGSGSTATNGAIPKRTGGIYFAVLDAEGANDKSRFNDILIDGCTIAYCDNTGIALDNEWNVFYPGGQNSPIQADRDEYQNWYDRRNTNLTIRNNTIHHIAKNAMIIRMADETGLIERNVCYETAIKTTGNTMFTARCKGTVFQYNEGYYNRSTTQTVAPGTIDGSMYDADFGSVGIIFQYSYSHDNSEGLYWGCNARSQSEVNSGIPDPNDVGTTVRYNISQNDLGDLIFLNYPSAGNEIYNNVFYIRSGASRLNIIHENSRSNHTYNFFNNIIYNLSDAVTGAKYAFGTGIGVQTRTISNNVFYGSRPATEPADPFKITADPLFANPGQGTTGINSVTGYKLQNTSPAINNGKVISNNGGLDYWGNPLYVATPDIGAFESNVPLPVTYLNFAARYQSRAVAVSWATASESTNAYFEVERSINAINYATLGRVAGKGSTQVRQTYGFTDESPAPGWNYYRLKQVDADGAFSLSRPVAILNEGNPAGTALLVYPNPATSTLTAELNGQAPVQAVSVYDIQGRRQNVPTHPTGMLNVGALPAGLYLIDVQTQDGRTLRQRFLKY